MSKISSRFQVPILKKLYHDLLRGFQRNIWCRGLEQDLTPVLESLEFFMSCSTLFLTKKYQFIVEILWQSCIFWHDLKNAKNKHLEVSYHKISTFPSSSKVIRRNSCKNKFWNFYRDDILFKAHFWIILKQNRILPHIFAEKLKKLKRDKFCLKKGC